MEREKYLPARNHSFDIPCTNVANEGGVEVVHFILKTFTQQATELWELLGFTVGDKDRQGLSPILDDSTFYDAPPVTIHDSRDDLKLNQVKS